MAEEGLTFTFEVAGEELIARRLSRFGDQATDLREFFDETVDDFQEVVSEQFDSVGGRVGGWRPLSPRYAAWKSKHAPGKPILQLTGAMRRSLVATTEQTIREVKRDFMRWGTRDPKARFHQRGTSRMPKRQIIAFDEADKMRVMKRLQRHLVATANREF